MNAKKIQMKFLIPMAVLFAFDAGALDITIPEGEDRSISPEEAAQLTGAEPLVKKGSGRLVMDKDLGDGYVGDVVVEAGTLACACAQSLGREKKTASENGSLSIGEGAVLEIAWATANGNYLQYRKSVTFGDGAKIVNTSGASQYNALAASGSFELQGGLEVAAGVKPNGELCRVDFRSASVAMAGHKISVSSGCLGFCMSKILSAGDIDVAAGAKLQFETVSEISPDAAEHLITFLGNGTSLGNGTLTLKNIPSGVVPLWGIESKGRLDLAMEAATANDAVWGGDIALGGMLYLTGSGCSLELTGLVSGTGPVQSRSLVVYLKNPGNTFTSGVSLRGSGKVVAPSANCIPNVAESVVEFGDDAGGTLVVEDASPFSNAEYAALQARCKAFKKAVVELGFASNYTYTASAVGGVEFAHPLGKGSVVFSGEIGETASVTNWSGELMMMTPGPSELGAITVCGGTVVLTNMGYVYSAAAKHSVDGEFPDVARLVVGNGTVFASKSNEGNVTYSSKIRIGNLSGTGVPEHVNPRGILEIQEGGVCTNILEVGTDSSWLTPVKAAGAVYLTGGHFGCYFSNRSVTECFGGRGYGYLGMASGSFDAGSVWLNFGGLHGNSGAGVWQMTGGTFEQTAYGMQLCCGNNASALLFLGGGEFKANTLWMCCSGSNTQLGRATLTVDGKEGAKWSGDLVLGIQDNSLSIVNLNSGVFQFGDLMVATNGYKNNNWTANFADDLHHNTFLNFNGGTLRFKNGNSKFSVANFTRATVFAGGARLDSNGSNISRGFSQSLLRPTGKGVKSIAIPDAMAELPAFAYIGSPVVTITDSGSGWGATAHAVFDETTGKVTAIKVTSPGCDYTDATAEITGGGWTNKFVAAVELEENSVAGGLTKTGGGTLTLTAVNTYGGKTRLEGGTLKLGCAGALPESSTIELAGGAIDFNGYVPTQAKWGLVLGDTASYPGDFTFPEGSSLVVEGLALADAEKAPYILLTTEGNLLGETPALVNAADLPKGMRLVRRAKKLVVDRERGVVLIVR